MSLLRVQGLTKEFGDLVAVDDVSFAVEDGEFVSILGPSGSGKSTVLRLIAGFEEPTAGDIQLAGEEIVGLPPFDRDVNMVFQDLALFPHLTVAENIGYGLKQADVPAPERRERTEQMLDMVHLEGYGDRDPKELSGGEQQRVALARALVNEPALVLFDEPLSSLDRKLRQHMQAELQRIQTESDTTFLYVTHDQEVAMAVSDRLVVLDRGAIQQVGSVDELYEAPDNKFVADFIGDVNTIEGRITDVDEDGVFVDAGSGEVRIARTAPGDLTAGAAVDICVRPYRLRLEAGEPGGESDGRFSATGVVRTRSYQGSDSRYVVETDTLGDLSAEVRGDSFDIGETVTVTWDARDVHLYPGDRAHDEAPEAS